MHNEIGIQPDRQTFPVYEFEGDLFKRQSLQGYLFNKIVTEQTKGDLLSLAKIKLNDFARRRIEQEVEVIIGELKQELMTEDEFMLECESIRKRVQSEQESESAIDIDLDEFFAELEAETNNAEIASTQSAKKTNKSNKSKTTFIHPDENEARDWLEDDEDPTHLYGKLGISDEDNPGISLATYFKPVSPASDAISEKIISLMETDTSQLQDMLAQIDPLTYDSNKRDELYMVSLVLSYRGVAPRWREYKRVFVEGFENEDLPQLVYSRDIQLFDLEWLRRTYPSHKPSKQMNGLYLALTDSEEFDFRHAFLIASSKFTAAEKSKRLRLSEAMQMDNFVIRSGAVDRRVKSLEKALDDVYADLLQASHKNRRRGIKLERVIPDRLNVWLSAELTYGNSVSVMAEQYQKITGKKISPSSFRKRLKATNKALLEVGSRQFIKELASL